VINHGVPERLIERVIEGIRGFFDLTEEEKREFEGKNVLDTIRCGTSFNTSFDKVFFWRDFLKVIIQHPHHLHFPDKPAGFRFVRTSDFRCIRCGFSQLNYFLKISML
jgi:isopenicillin N synthase-like dioxygenase